MQYWPNGERCPYTRVREIKHRHPDLTDDIVNVPRNTVIVGSAGTGKSIAMRQICVGLETSDHSYPIYMHTERWLARILSHMVGEVDLNSPSGARVRKCATAALGIGIVKRIYALLGEDAAIDAAQILPDPPSRNVSLDLWLSQQGSIYNNMLTARNRMSKMPEVPDLRTTLEYVADVVMERTRRETVFLLDQLDRVTPVYFDLVQDAMARSYQYRIAIATRPSPCAPEPTRLRVRAGDCQVLWLGSYWTTDAWTDFLNYSMEEWFSKAVASQMRHHIERIARLVGPSTREFLEVVNISATIGRPVDDSAIYSSLVALKGRWEEDIERSLVGFDDSATFLRRLAIQITDPLARTRLAIKPDSQFLTERTKGRLRVAIREGLFVPVDTARYGVDSVDSVVKVVPPASTKLAVENSELPTRTSEITLNESTFLRWGDQPHFQAKRTTSTSKPAIFYSHWMNERNDHAQAFLPAFRQYLTEWADVVTGTRSEKWSEDSTLQVDVIADTVRDRISKSSLVVVQLDRFRPGIGLEIGWANGFAKSIVLAIGNQEEFSALPEWIQPVEKQNNGKESEWAEFVGYVIERLEAEQRAQSSSRGRTLKRQRQLRQLTIVGSGPQMQAVQAQADALLDQEGLPAAMIFDTATKGRGNFLFDIADQACRTTSLITVFSGVKAPDLLTNVALGAHTYRDKDPKVPIPGTRSTVTLKRRCLVLDTDTKPEPLPRTMLLGLPEAVVSADATEIVEAALGELLTVARRIHHRAERGTK